jgi:ribosomal protein L37AE/L43A
MQKRMKAKQDKARRYANSNIENSDESEEEEHSAPANEEEGSADQEEKARRSRRPKKIRRTASQELAAKVFHLSEERDPYFCPICKKKEVWGLPKNDPDSLWICCDQCKLWYHAGCAGLEDEEYSKLSESDEKWKCQTCKLSSSSSSSCAAQSAESSTREKAEMEVDDESEQPRRKKIDVDYEDE